MTQDTTIRLVEACDRFHVRVGLTGFADLRPAGVDPVEAGSVGMRPRPDTANSSAAGDGVGLR